MAWFPKARPFVQAALDAVGRAGMVPVDMRYFAARDSSPADYCRARVRECEIYVAVVGFRYGSVVPGEAVSFTELEFQVASDVGMPRLVFLLEETACPPGQGDDDRGLVERFRQRLRDAGLVVRSFSSGDGLELEIFHALSELSSGGRQPDEPPLTFAGLLRQLRAEAGLTQRELGQKAGLSWQLVSDLEQGRAVASRAGTVRLLANALKLTGVVRAAFEAAVAGRGPPGSGVPGLTGTAPKVWNVPNRNADFTGRTAILEKLHDELAGDCTAVVLARALYGLGGVGKTQVALEYAHRFKACYDLIWWVPAEQPQGISLVLADLAGRLGLQAGDNVVEAAAAALEQLRLGAAGRWLLIFDNAEDPVDLEPFLPAGPGHVLITSRNQAWSRHAEPLELDVFARQESVAHLMRHVPRLEPDEAAKVAAAVGDLPLAIEQAAAWLAETGMPATFYVEWLETQATSALGLTKPSGYAMPVAATWNLSLSRLKDRSPAAVRLLQILAFCSPEPISMKLLYGDELNAVLLPFDETLRDKFMLGQVIREISRLALVKIDQASGSLHIHRLVQAVIRSQMSDEQQRDAAHEVHKILAGARPRQGETDDPANWSTYDIIWPHIGPSWAEKCDDPRTRQLLIDWVRYQWKLGEFESGLALAERLTDLWTRNLGPDHQQTLHLQSQSANVLRSEGRFGEARDLDTYVLARQRTVLGADHPHALMTANGLGADLRALGDYQQALATDRETYNSFKEQFGEDYPRTLMAAHNLAASLRLVGDCFTARALDEETLDRQRRVLGQDHPYTLTSAASLALDMRAAGAFRDSVDLLHDTWERYRRVLGDEMLDTLRTAASLAVSLRKSGEQLEARNLSEDTYERYERRYGIGSPDALSCAVNLACDYAALGDNARARRLAEEIGTAYRSSLGENHPCTLVTSNNLAIYLHNTGEREQARILAEQTLITMHNRLGEDHPLSLCCAVNLANRLADSGNLTQAEALERETIPRLQKTLSSRHPDTLACEANLAVTLHLAGHDEDAEQVRARILDSFSQVLGPCHPDAALLQDWYHVNRELEIPLI